MKIYYLKYLSTDDDLEIGDKCIENFSGEVLTYLGTKTYSSGIEVYMFEEYEEECWINTKDVGCPYKAKLFLCSRDIQVGDRVIKLQGTYNEGEGYVKKIENDIYSVELDENEEKIITSYRPKNLTKVIGEVSSKAVWLEEGDVDIEDFKIIYRFPITKTYRNGVDKDYIYHEADLSDDFIRDKAEHWGEHINNSGHNYGYELEWGDSEIAHVAFKCNNCKTFH